MYTVVGATKSRAFRVMWMLEELGQAYQQIAAGPRSPEAHEYNPLGKIPSLVDGDVVLTDSVAIMSYLGDKHGGLMAKPSTPERAKQDAMTLWLIDEFDANLWAFTKHTFALPENLRVPELKQTLIAEFVRATDRLAGQLDGPYLMGDQLTLPDLLAVHCINWSIGLGYPSPNDKVAEWANTLRARTAFKAVRARAPS